MFICLPCHRGTECKQEFVESLLRSRGECEVCHTPAACLDCHGYKDIPLTLEQEAIVRESEVFDNAGPEQKALFSRLYGERTELRNRVAELESAQAERVRLLKLAIDGRREYASIGAVADMPGLTDQDLLRAEAYTLTSALKIVEGDVSPMYALMPSWRWEEAGLT